MQAVKAAPEKEILPKMQERKELRFNSAISLESRVSSLSVKEHSVKTVCLVESLSSALFCPLLRDTGQASEFSRKLPVQYCPGSCKAVHFSLVAFSGLSCPVLSRPEGIPTSTHLLQPSDQLLLNLFPLFSCSFRGVTAPDPKSPNLRARTPSIIVIGADPSLPHARDSTRSLGATLSEAARPGSSCMTVFKLLSFPEDHRHRPGSSGGTAITLVRKFFACR